MNPDEQREFQRFLDTSDKCSGEWQQFKKLKEVTQDIGFKTPPDEVWDKYWENVYNRWPETLNLFSLQPAVLHS